MDAKIPLKATDYPTQDAYLQAMRLKYHTRHRTKDQAGIADLPLFQTDLEEFTGADAIRP